MAVCLVLFYPFLSVLLIGASLAVVMHPLYEWLEKRFKNRSGLAALATVLIFVIVLGVPLYFIGGRVFTESESLYGMLTVNGTSGDYTEMISTRVHELFPITSHMDVSAALKNIGSFFAGKFAGFFTATLHTTLSLFLIILSLFYFLKDGDRWRNYLIKLSPLSDKRDERILTMLGRAINGVMKGYLLVALAQGVLMGIGLWIFGVPNFMLWGVLAGLAATVPTIGTALVSVPAILYLFLTGATFPAVGLLIWAIIVVGTIDNVLNPYIVGSKIDLHPLVVLFAVLGGLALLGAPGILIGPIAVSLLHTLIIIYKEDFLAPSKA